MAWNEDRQFDTWIYQYGYFQANKDIRRYRDWQTTVPDFNFATGADVSGRQVEAQRPGAKAAWRAGAGWTRPQAAAQGCVTVVPCIKAMLHSLFAFPTLQLRSGLYGTGTAMLNPANYVVYGYARTNLAPRAFSQGVAFRLRVSAKCPRRTHLGLFKRETDVKALACGHCYAKPLSEYLSICPTCSCA